MSKPVMLYDGDCGFCRRWVRRWQGVTGDRVVYVPYQGHWEQYPVTQEQCQKAVQLVFPGGEVLSGAAAVFRALREGGRYRALWWMYRNVPFFGKIAERVYRWIARRRKR